MRQCKRDVSCLSVCLSVCPSVTTRWSIERSALIDPVLSYTLHLAYSQQCYRNSAISKNKNTPFHMVLIAKIWVYEIVLPVPARKVRSTMDRQRSTVYHNDVHHCVQQSVRDASRRAESSASADTCQCCTYLQLKGQIPRQQFHCNFPVTSLTHCRLSLNICYSEVCGKTGLVEFCLNCSSPFCMRSLSDLTITVTCLSKIASNKKELYLIRATSVSLFNILNIQPLYFPPSSKRHV